MNANQSPIEKQAAGKQNAFTIMNNVRDHCKQSDAKVRLMFVLATYCNREGICWPSNETLMQKMGRKKRMIQKWLAELKADGEISVLKSGAGRDKRRKISLTRYILSTHVHNSQHFSTLKVHSASACLDVQCPPSKTCQNIHSEHPTLSTRGTHHLALRAANGETSVSKYTAEEREKLQSFRRILSDRDPRWLPVNAYSEGVSQALELVNAAAMKALCEAAALLTANGEDDGDFTWRPTGEGFTCYLPTPNKGSGKWALVRLIQCNREELPLCE